MSLINKMIEFQNSPKEEQNKWCSHCGCTGGCCLCEDINKIK